jgi:hypothetical protein
MLPYASHPTSPQKYEYIRIRKRKRGKKRKRRGKNDFSQRIKFGHRDGWFLSSRWLVSVIAMIGFYHRDDWKTAQSKTHHKVNIPCSDVQDFCIKKVQNSPKSV